MLYSSGSHREAVTAVHGINVLQMMPTHIVMQPREQASIILRERICRQKGSAVSNPLHNEIDGALDTNNERASKSNSTTISTYMDVNLGRLITEVAV
jgi:hypothetical protein